MAGYECCNGTMVQRYNGKMVKSLMVYWQNLKQSYAFTPLRFCSIPYYYQMLFHSPDIGSEGIEANIYILIAAVDLFDIMNNAFAFCRKCCDEEGNSGPDIG